VTSSLKDVCSSLWSDQLSALTTVNIHHRGDTKGQSLPIDSKKKASVLNMSLGKWGFFLMIALVFICILNRTLCWFTLYFPSHFGEPSSALGPVWIHLAWDCV